LLWLGLPYFFLTAVLLELPDEEEEPELRELPEEELERWELPEDEEAER
jgi:hypothetical protein